MREFTWGVAGASDIEAIGAELSRDMPVKTDKAGRLKTIDPTGHGIAFAKTRRVPVVGEGSELNWFGKARRVDTRFEFITRGAATAYRPRRRLHAQLRSGP
jgi:hypothetical protein